MKAADTLNWLKTQPDYVRLHDFPDLLTIDLKYASADNFMSKDVYGEFNEAYLHRIAAQKLLQAAQRLKTERPRWKLLILDALRPRSVQRILWAHVEGTAQEAYVAHPERGSVHNYGLAVDLTCVDESGNQIPMGSPFDHFHPISEPRSEERFLASGELSRQGLENRLLLRQAMTGAGFIQLPHEWWHYDALAREEIRDRFRLIE